MVGPGALVRGCGLGGGVVTVSCRRVLGLVVVAVLVGSVLGVGAGAGAASEGFSDLDAAGVHRSAVEGLAARGVFEGTECGTGGVLSDGSGAALGYGCVAGAPPRRC